MSPFCKRELIDYAQLSIAHLTRALIDPGKLGVISRALIQLQHDHLGYLGMHNTGQMGKNPNHYRLIKQLELASEAGLSIRPVVDTANASSIAVDADNFFRRPHMPNAPAFGLASVTYNLHADPRMLGERQPVPASVYHCLAEIGITYITNLPPLICKNKKRQVVQIDTVELKGRHGLQVQALNNLTVLAN